MRLAVAVVIGVTAASLAACATREPPPSRSRPPAARRAMRPPIVIRPLFPADYMATASSIDLYEIRSAELALTRSANPRLRNFARTMIAAHKGTSAQLSFAGRRVNLLPSATMLPRHQAMLDDLAAAGNFDAAYRRQQLAVHQAAIKLHGDFAARGESPTLRAVARNAAPIERRHLDTIRRI
jgi:putative membrane protein